MAGQRWGIEWDTRNGGSGLYARMMRVRILRRASLGCDQGDWFGKKRRGVVCDQCVKSVYDCSGVTLKAAPIRIYKQQASDVPFCHVNPKS